MDEDMTVSIGADTTEFQTALENLRDLSERFGSQLGSALRGAAVSGRSLDDVLRRIGLSLAGMALNRGLAPLRSIGQGFLADMVGGLARAVRFENGGVPGRVTPFADGGIVSAPTYFPMGGQLGLMGEAGAEAILPLARGPDGRLGVAGGGSAAPVNIVFNVSTPDASSFRKSEAQVAGMLARAVSRGARAL